MTMVNTLLLGFLIGLKHALEVDHVVAVASLASKTTSVREGLTLGISWGLGHIITLSIFSSIVLILDTVVSAQLALTLEFSVGCMLVFMGGTIIQNIAKKRIHLHMHNHSDGTTNLHFHSHLQDNVEHQHTHTQQFSIRALLVGMVHGMAGSAALIVLTLDSVSSIETRLIYIFLFGVGSVIGMALLSLLMIIPLRRFEYAANRTYQSLQVFIGLVTLFLGMIIMYDTSFTNGLLV